MKTLTQFGLMAEAHWRQFLPRMTAHLEATGQLQTLLREAAAKTEAELDELRRHFLIHRLTPEQAHQRAWEMVRERYLLLPPES
jgi:hypothetical protein